jgi:hypothetical protein
MANYIIFNINGGIGKCVAATAVCAAIKKSHPEYDLIVVSGYPEVFLNNPNVKKSFPFGNTPYFYNDYIEGHNVKILFHDPYLTSDYVQRKKHLIEAWCNLYRIEYNGELPELFLTQREVDFAQRQVNLTKPMLIMQTNGGGENVRKYSWARDIPADVVMPVIEHFRNDYDIVHVRRQDQPEYPNTITLTATFRQIAAVAMLSQKRFVMDSFLQHTLAALKLPAVSLWVANSPKVFGYDLHTSIEANPFTVEPDLRNSFLEKFNIGGEENEFPYRHEREIFDVQQVIDAIEKSGEPKRPTRLIEMPETYKDSNSEI